MPLATTARYQGHDIDVTRALELRDAYDGERLPFLCVGCSQRVRPHEASADGSMAAHFEHLDRNTKCRFSDAYDPH